MRSRKPIVDCGSATSRMASRCRANKWRHRATRAALLLSALACFGADERHSIASAQSIRLSIEDALRVREFGPLMRVAPSPDGQWLAYTIREKDRVKSIDLIAYARSGVPPWGSGGDIAIMNPDTGVTRNLTGGAGDNWSPTWSPDGRYLAFLSNRDGSGQARLWVWDAVKDGLVKISDVDVRGDQIAWAGNRTVLALVLPEGISVEDYTRKHAHDATEENSRTESALGPTVIIYQGSGLVQGAREAPTSDPWNLDIDLRDLVSFDVVSRKADTKVHGGRIARYMLSPDSSRIAYTVPTRFERPGSQQILFDLAVVNMLTHKERVVVSDIRLDYAGASFNWSPDGSHLGFRTGGVDEETGDCYVVDPNDGTPRNVSMSAGANQPSTRDAVAPLWDVSGERIFFVRGGSLWQARVDRNEVREVARIADRQIVEMTPQSGNFLWTPDGGKSTVVATHDETGKQDGFYKIDLGSGESSKLLENAQCYTCHRGAEQLTVMAHSQEVTFFVEDVQHDEDLWISDSDFRRARRLTHLNPQFDQYKMGAARLIHWLSDDGERLEGALLLPSDFEEGKKYPLIAWVYGGLRLSNELDHFGFEGSGPLNMQLLATRGYAVLVPDAPQHLGTAMVDLAKTVLPGVNKAVEMGIADPDRLGVMGHSYGGYSTLALIVQSGRFKAAVEADGFGDLIGAYGAMNEDGTAFETSVMENGSGQVAGTPWEYRERYIENSPFFHFERIVTPLLIVQGAKDRTVPAFLGDETFVALRRLGKEVEYAKYKGEGHSPLGWRYANQVDFCERIIGWFNVHLAKSN
jgi:dipeptidyl aminopeptidase/acylaminoacyl peptidase